MSNNDEFNIQVLAKDMSDEYIVKEVIRKK